MIFHGTESAMGEVLFSCGLFLGKQAKGVKSTSRIAHCFLMRKSYENPQTLPVA